MLCIKVYNILVGGTYLNSSKFKIAAIVAESCTRNLFDISWLVEAGGCLGSYTYDSKMLKYQVEYET